MHLDTVFTLLDRDKATAYPKVVEGIRAFSLRPGAKAGRWTSREDKDLLSAVADALGITKLHVVETGGDAYQQEREQWDDGNNVVALEPGVVVAYERNTFTISKMREAGVEVIAIAGLRTGQGSGRRSLHDLSDRPRPDLREAPWNAATPAGSSPSSPWSASWRCWRSRGERAPRAQPTAARGRWPSSMSSAVSGA